MPIPETAQLSIDPVDDQYAILKRVDIEHNETSIELTLNDALHLAQNMSQWAQNWAANTQKKILEKDPDLQVSLNLSVEGAEVNVDLHQSHITLALTDNLGAISRFALNPSLAKALAEDFVRRAKEIENSPQTRQ